MSSFTSLRSQVAGQIFGGLAASLSTTISGGQITTLATDSATAAAAIIAAVPGSSAPQSTPDVIALQAEQAATIFAGLASGMASITGSQITSIVATAVTVWPLFKPRSSRRSAPHLLETSKIQTESAVQVFAGLALGLSSISGGQITSIASSAATAAAAIQTAI